MRYVWAIVCALLISTTSPAYSGGMSGGTGIGGLIEEIAEGIQELLKHPIQIDPEAVRRLLIRLWVYGEGDIKVGDKIIHVKWKYKVDPGEDGNHFDISIVATVEAKPAEEGA